MYRLVCATMCMLKVSEKSFRETFSPFPFIMFWELNPNCQAKVIPRWTVRVVPLSLYFKIPTVGTWGEDLETQAKRGRNFSCGPNQSSNQLLQGGWEGSRCVPKTEPVEFINGSNVESKERRGEPNKTLDHWSEPWEISVPLIERWGYGFWNAGLEVGGTG